MGFFEIFMVLVIAIIFLGPDKLPQALIDLAKFFKAVKKTLDDAKTSIDKELNLEELKKEALEYKQTFTQSLEELNHDIKISDEIKELEEPKNSQEKIKEEIPSHQTPAYQNLENTPQSKSSKVLNQEIKSQDQLSSDSTLDEPTSQNSVHFVKPSKANFQETSYKDS